MIPNQLDKVDKVVREVHEACRGQVNKQANNQANGTGGS